MTRPQLVSIFSRRLCTLKIEQFGCSSGEILVIDVLDQYCSLKIYCHFCFPSPSMMISILRGGVRSCVYLSWWPWICVHICMLYLQFSWLGLGTILCYFCKFVTRFKDKCLIYLPKYSTFMHSGNILFGDNSFSCLKHQILKCMTGILLDRKGSGVSFQAISGIPLLQSLSTMLQVRSLPILLAVETSFYLLYIFISISMFCSWILKSNISYSLHLEQMQLLSS